MLLADGVGAAPSPPSDGRSASSRPHWKLMRRSGTTSEATRLIEQLAGHSPPDPPRSTPPSPPPSSGSYDDRPDGEPERVGRLGHVDIDRDRLE